MFNRLIIYILFSVFALISCSAPNSNVSTKNKKTSKSKSATTKKSEEKQDKGQQGLDNKSEDLTKVVKKPESNKNEMLEFGEKPSTIPNRSKDTITTVLKELEIKKAEPEKVDAVYQNLVVEFEKVISEFDKENYNKAMQKFSFFKETLMQTDSLYYESMFYMSECNISLGNYSSAENILTILVKTDIFENKTIEKSLLRLGQVKCALNDEKLANDLFKELKRKYPKSIYLKLASCNALTSSK